MNVFTPEQTTSLPSPEEQPQLPMSEHIENFIKGKPPEDAAVHPELIDDMLTGKREKYKLTDGDLSHFQTIIGQHDPSIVQAHVFSEGIGLYGKKENGDIFMQEINLSQLPGGQAGDSFKERDKGWKFNPEKVNQILADVSAELTKHGKTLQLNEDPLNNTAKPEKDSLVDILGAIKTRASVSGRSSHLGSVYMKRLQGEREATGAYSPEELTTDGHSDKDRALLGIW